ncbi:hypothetical protein BDZ97DRAFT_1924498 [Flammula alnicola]|nr:hypothetical protein BDZ97DRAFT_1924498 [Flammula alnicola]
MLRRLLNFFSSPTLPNPSGDAERDIRGAQVNAGYPYYQWGGQNTGPGGPIVPLQPMFYPFQPHIPNAGGFPAPYHGYLPPPYPAPMMFPPGQGLGYPFQIQGVASANAALSSTKPGGIGTEGKVKEEVREVGPTSMAVQSGKALKEEDPTNDATDWPDGPQRREVPFGHEKRKWKDTKWVWRSSGNVYRNGHHAEMRLCLGVFSCNNETCRRLVRPKTGPSSRTQQAKEPCRMCKSDLVLTKCDAKTYHYKISRNGQAFLVWEHDGHHKHPRPPGGNLSRAQEEAVDKQVLRNFDASAHELWTGDTGPGSIPLSEISPALANPRAARYQLSQSQARLGIAPSIATKGGLSILRSLAELQEELKKPFMINSSLHGPVFLMFQTPFMETVLQDSIISWNEEDSEGPNSARHGFVTDGDHSFFRDGVLIVTCVFNMLMVAWVPVLYTWILRQDIAHHRPHFRHISRSVVTLIQRRGLAFEKKYLLHVFDFSASQRGAHAEEFADAIIAMDPRFQSLTAASQEIERNEYLKQAQEAERGCEFHFWQSAERIMSNGALVPQAKSGEFNRLLRSLVSSKTSLEDFDTTVQTLRSEFPRIHGWLSWWLRPAFASMIFPAVSAIDRTIADQIPTTSNPVEHQHSLLHHAVGVDQDLIPGIKKLFLHVQELESQYTGHFDPASARKYRPPAHKEWDANDGRPPDTEAALHPRGIRDDGTQNPNALLSYKWRSPNSCFVDNSLEIWFRAYSLWSDEARQAFLLLVPKDSFLDGLTYRYDRCLKYMHDSTSLAKFKQDLDLTQTIILNYVVDKWKLVASGGYGCSMEWLSTGVKDGNPPLEIQAHFGVHYLLTRECVKGHASSASALDRPQVWLQLYERDICTTQAFDISRKTVALSDYFAHFIPRGHAVGGSTESGRTPLHLLPNEPCADKSCTLFSAITRISHSWPQVLNIVSDARADSNTWRDEGHCFAWQNEDQVAAQPISSLKFAGGEVVISVLIPLAAPTGQYGDGDEMEAAAAG